MRRVGQKTKERRCSVAICSETEMGQVQPVQALTLAFYVGHAVAKLRCIKRARFVFFCYFLYGYGISSCGDTL